MCAVSDFSMKEMVRYMRGYSVGKFDYNPRELQDLTKDAGIFGLVGMLEEKEFTELFKHKAKTSFISMFYMGKTVLSFIKGKNQYLDYMADSLELFDPNAFYAENSEKVHNAFDIIFNNHGKLIHPIVVLILLIIAHCIKSSINKTMEKQVAAATERYKKVQDLYANQEKNSDGSEDSEDMLDSDLDTLSHPP